MDPGQNNMPNLFLRLDLYGNCMKAALYHFRVIYSIMVPNPGTKYFTKQRARTRYDAFDETLRLSQIISNHETLGIAKTHCKIIMNHMFEPGSNILMQHRARAR